MSENWVITNGRKATSPPMLIAEPVNLDFVTKVIYGGNFKAPTTAQTKSLYFFHGVSNGTGLTAGTICYIYNSVAEAQAAYYKVIQSMLNLGIAVDLRGTSSSIATVSPTSTAHAVATTITVTGQGFNPNGYIVINAVQMPINAAASKLSLTFTLDITIAAGTYDVEYYDLAGNYAVLSQGIILT